MSGCAHRDQITVDVPEQSGRPIISLLEPGEDWSWCYLDQLAFVG